MKILYLTNVPVPEDRTTDAHFQELDLLVEQFGGEVISTFPLQRPSSLLPRSLYGVQNKRELKKASQEADIIHIFSPVLYPYRYIRRLDKKPIIYSSLTPVSNFKPIKKVDKYIVYDEKSYKKIQSIGTIDVGISPPFVDFQKNILPVPDEPFTLLMASAPWEKSQFKTKGIHLILEALNRIPDLHVVFIWRHILFEEMRDIVQESPNRDRIKLINRHVDIAAELSNVHAVILLAQFSSLVKSFPHSLMEGLLSGRPVLTTASIPIGKEISDHNYGEVLQSFSIEALEDGIEKLKENYAVYRENTRSIPENKFGKQTFLAFYDQLYQGMIK